MAVSLEKPPRPAPPRRAPLSLVKRDQCPSADISDGNKLVSRSGNTHDARESRRSDARDATITEADAAARSAWTSVVQALARSVARRDHERAMGQTGKDEFGDEEG